jgi:hypothetical protein
MDTSRRKVLALCGVGSAAFFSGAAADFAPWQRIEKLVDAASHQRRQDALAFVKSVNSDLRRYGLPPLDDGYISRALGQASPT